MTFTTYCHLKLHHFFKQMPSLIKNLLINIKLFLVIILATILRPLINVIRKIPIVNRIGNKIITKHPTFFLHQSLTALLKLRINMPVVSWMVVKFDAKFPSIKIWLKRQIYKGEKSATHIQLPHHLSTQEINMFMMKLHQEILEQKKAKGEVNL